MTPAPSSPLPLPFALPLYNALTKLWVAFGYVRAETAKIWQHDLRLCLNAGPTKRVDLRERRLETVRHCWPRQRSVFFFLDVAFFLKLVAQALYIIYILYFIKKLKQF